jgi:hypothetical protein
MLAIIISTTVIFQGGKIHATDSIGVRRAGGFSFYRILR